MMSHDEASDLLGAYALDAVDGDERTELEAHLETCPRSSGRTRQPARCRGGDGNSVEPPPEGLWSQIAIACLSSKGTRSRPRCRGSWGRATRLSGRRPPAGSRRGAAPCVTTVGAVAVAAAAVAVVLGIGLVRADNKVSNLQSAQAAPSAAVTAALTAPGHRVVTLDGGTHGSKRRSSSCRRGRATWSRRRCPRSTRVGRTSCGRLRGTSPISLGLLGRFAEPCRLHHGRIDTARRT